MKRIWACFWPNGYVCVSPHDGGLKCVTVGRIGDFGTEMSYPDTDKRSFMIRYEEYSDAYSIGT